MVYVTQADLVARFGEREILDIAYDEATEGIDAERVSRACEDAEGEINGSLAAAGYHLPLSQVPSVVTAYGCDIARYRLYDDRATEQVTRRYDDAIKFLRGVARGDLRLGLPTAQQDDAQSSGEAMFVASGRRDFPGGSF